MHLDHEVKLGRNREQTVEVRTRGFSGSMFICMLMREPTQEGGTRTMYLTSISQTQARQLVAALGKAIKEVREDEIESRKKGGR